jgi:protein ImuA
MFDPLQIPNVFRARSVRSSTRKTLPTGFDALDAALLGGWPHPALIEILIDAYGIGELRMLLPLLRSLASINSSPLIVWLNSPYLPNAVALEQSGVHATNWVSRDLSERDLLWISEQCLRSTASSAVLAWSKAPSTAALRRLKLAAASTSSVGSCFVHWLRRVSRHPQRSGSRCGPSAIDCASMSSSSRVANQRRYLWICLSARARRRSHHELAARVAFGSAEPGVRGGSSCADGATAATDERAGPGREIDSTPPRLARDSFAGVAAAFDADAIAAR